MDARAAYRRGEGQTAGPVRLVVLLYEQLIADLRGAALAIERDDIETRTHQLSHAFQVLGELEGSLKLEVGEVAVNLQHYYGLLRSSLIQLPFKPDPRVLEKHIESLLSLREAWLEVERQTAAPVNNAQAASGPALQSETAGTDWSV